VADRIAGGCFRRRRSGGGLKESDGLTSQQQRSGGAPLRIGWQLERDLAA